MLLGISRTRFTATSKVRHSAASCPGGVLLPYVHESFVWREHRHERSHRSARPRRAAGGTRLDARFLGGATPSHGTGRAAGDRTGPASARYAGRSILDVGTPRSVVRAAARAHPVARDLYRG